METSARLTRLASCAGCGAKVGAGTLARLLQDFKTRTDPRLIVGFDKSDDASVYVINDETALIQTVDFFPPIVDDPYLFGQIAAANAISDIYAMGGEPRLALNLMCTAEGMQDEWTREILRGGYDKAFEAGVIISGGHTIRGSEPLYGLAVTGFAKPGQIRKNAGAAAGDVLILTKPLGIGILTTAAKADLAAPDLMDRLYRQMATLNKDACRIMQKYRVHACTDVTGFGLMGHSCEMAQGSGCTLHLLAEKIPFHEEALEMADMGLVPAGAYRNRQFAEKNVSINGTVSRAFQDILYDPQTSGGLLIAVDPDDAGPLLQELKAEIPCACEIGYAAAKEEADLILEGTW
ncbi:MAG: selenide, water dikinase SelD [Lachnospiraceae bacterium]|nr:selenide, water dikinase SelD [Lachnospiraceae bacterium]